MKKNLYTGVFFIAFSCFLFGMTIFLNLKENELASELNQKYTDVDADKIDSSYNGNLINVSGNISYEGEANDKEFNLNVDTAILKRNVEVFVWIQETEINNGKTTYTYRQKWMNELVDSSKFEIKDRYENPKSISNAFPPLRHFLRRGWGVFFHNGGTSHVQRNQTSPGGLAEKYAAEKAAHQNYSGRHRRGLRY